MLAHVYRPSLVKGEKYEAFIFLAHHEHLKSGSLKIEAITEIEKAEFFFGSSWGNQIFPVENRDRKGPIGVSVHAWGTFLATCRITFSPELGREPIVLQRFIDFFMLPEEGVTTLSSRKKMQPTAGQTSG